MLSTCLDKIKVFARAECRAFFRRSTAAAHPVPAPISGARPFLDIVVVREFEAAVAISIATGMPPPQHQLLQILDNGAAICGPMNATFGLPPPPQVRFIRP
jgi:hypothetical protein